jgi:hypothetical protein
MAVSTLRLATPDSCAAARQIRSGNHRINPRWGHIERRSAASTIAPRRCARVLTRGTRRLSLHAASWPNCSCARRA